MAVYTYAAVLLTVVISSVGMRAWAGSFGMIWLFLLVGWALGSVLFFPSFVGVYLAYLFWRKLTDRAWPADRALTAFGALAAVFAIAISIFFWEGLYLWLHGTHSGDDYLPILWGFAPALIAGPVLSRPMLKKMFNA